MHVVVGARHASGCHGIDFILASQGLAAGASGLVIPGPKKDHSWLQAAINIAWPKPSEQDLRLTRVGRPS
eukprot:14228935-Alexandrium_andersonii.AAC.1